MQTSSPDSKQTSVKSFLEHHGVRGQKWGIRNRRVERHDPGHEGEKVSRRKLKKLDQKWIGDPWNKKTTPANTYEKIHGMASKETSEKDIPRINSKPQYKGQDLTKNKALRRQYNQEVQNAYLDNVNKAAGSLGTNPSGTKKYGIIENSDGSWDLIRKNVSHDTVSDDAPIRLNLTYDSLGHVVSITPALLTHEGVNKMNVDTFLAHHGVRGQKWGFRKQRVSESHHETHKLSDDELHKKIKRLELEKKFSELSSGSKSAGHKYVGDILNKSGKQVVSVALGTAVSLAVGKALKGSLG